LSTHHAEAIRARIQPHRATPSSTLAVTRPPTRRPPPRTTPSSTPRENAVSVTYTINDDFGAKVIAGDTGFLLNDEMDDFTAKPGAANLFGLVQGNANAIAPGSGL